MARDSFISLDLEMGNDHEIEFYKIETFFIFHKIESLILRLGQVRLSKKKTLKMTL